MFYSYYCRYKIKKHFVLSKTTYVNLVLTKDIIRNWNLIVVFDTNQMYFTFKQNQRET